jgi:hypothetical protein
MSKVEIGAGFIVAALGGFNLLQNTYVNIILLVIGAILILHGCYEEFLRPGPFLKYTLKKWLLERNFKIIKDEQMDGAYFCIWVEDEFHRQIMVSRHKQNKGIVAFTGIIRLEPVMEQILPKFNPSQKLQLVEEIRIYFTSKNMGYWDVDWPLDKIKIQTGLPVNSQLNAHSVDLCAKEIVNSNLGVRSIIRKMMGAM